MARVGAPIRAQPFGKLNRKREVLLRWLDVEVVEVVEQRGLVGIASSANMSRESVQICLLHRATGDEETDVGLGVGCGQAR